MSAIIPTSAHAASAAEPAQVATLQLAASSATPSFAVDEASPRATRRGRPNYTPTEIGTLLDIVGQVEPLGANMWALVASRYAEWAAEVGCPPRAQDSLKNKFDKMAGETKKTGVAFCPPEIRRAKDIARAILGSCHAVDAGSEDGIEPPEPQGPGPVSGTGGGDEEREDNEAGPVPTNATGGPLPPIGTRIRKRAFGAGGVGGKKRKDPLLVCVEKVAASMAAITEVITAPPAVGPLPTASIEEVVRAEVGKAMEKNTKELQEMKKFIEILAKK